MNWQPDLYTVCLTGFGASALGLAGLLVRPSRKARWRGRVALVLALLALVGGAAAGLVGVSEPFWLPPLTLSAAWLLLAGLRQPAAAAAARLLFTAARNRLAHCAALLLI